VSVGMDWATPRKKSSMYWSDAGSYCMLKLKCQRYMHIRDCVVYTANQRLLTNINLNGISVAEATHMAVREEPVGK
jgi:hypothetical protein